MMMPINAMRLAGGYRQPAGYDYAGFLSGRVGDAWLAAGINYADTGRTTVAVPGDGVASLTGQGAQFNAAQATSTARPTLAVDSGVRYLSFDGGDALDAGAAGNWNWLHNASGDAYICGAWRFGAVADPNTTYPTLNTCQGASAQVGFSSWYDDRTPQSRNDALTLLVGRGVNGSPAINTTSANGVVPSQTDVVVEYVKTGSSVQAFVNGVGVLSVSLTSASASNSFGALCIGGYPSSGSDRLVGRAYGIVCCSGLPSSGQRTGIQQDMASRCVVPPTI